MFYIKVCIFLPWQCKLFDLVIVNLSLNYDFIVYEIEEGLCAGSPWLVKVSVL